MNEDLQLTYDEAVALYEILLATDPILDLTHKIKEYLQEQEMNFKYDK